MLDKSKPYGTISGEGFHASYSQFDGNGKEHFFNTQGFEVNPSTGDVIEKKPAPVVTPEASAAAAVDDKERVESARDLLRQADTMKFNEFAVRAAAVIGGKNPPMKKQPIVEALQAILDEAAGPVPASAPVEKEQVMPKPVETAPQPMDVIPDQVSQTKEPEVDLAAWARGEDTTTIWPDVSKAIRERLSRDVSTKRDAVDALIEAGVVSADEAMQVD